MKYLFLKISLICVLIGILAGALSSSLIYSYFFSFMDIGGILMEKRDSSSLTKIRLMDMETKKNVSNSIVVFYKIKPLNKDPMQNILFEKDKVGYGFVVTSDGLVVADKIISAFGVKQIVALLSDGRAMEIKKIEKDLKNGLAFVRLDVTGLQPISFGNPRDLMPGENLYLVDGVSKISKIYFSGIGYKTAISEISVTNSSEYFGRVLLFGEAVGSEFNGLPILNYRGEAVGIARSDGKIISYGAPMDYAQKSLQSLFKYGRIKQVFLGVEYLDLAHIATIDTTQEKRGALILSVVDEDNNLKAGDVILRINGEELNKEYNLSEIISDYQIGDKLNFYILRDKKEQSVEVILGEE